MKACKKLAGMLLFCGSCVWTGCSDDPDTPLHIEDYETGQVAVSDEIYYANMFGKDAMTTFYYWDKEIADDLEQWDVETNEDPIGTVDRIKYHEGEKYIDKWTMLTDDMSSFTSSVEGVSTTFGWNLTVYRLSEDSDLCVGAVNFVYAGGPAEKAGLRRGDILISLDGKDITLNNYTDLYYASALTVGIGKLEGENTIVSTGREVSLSALTMYEHPVVCDSIYEFGGKKVGYLAYSSFDMNSIPDVVAICKRFKQEGVKELVLDLRYNGGGYVITEGVLASMFAPEAPVKAGEVFEKEVYNDYMTGLYRQEGISLETDFSTEFDYYDLEGNEQHVSTADANIGLERVYGIISSGTASASEALLGGLMPYMDVKLIGSPSHGKYCTGILLSAQDAYDRCPEEIRNWGIYVMVSIYQNASGATPCMPDGLQPDIEADDDPLLPYQLGDVDEPMLRMALQEAGREYDEPAEVKSRSAGRVLKKLPGPRTPAFGKRILLPSTSLPVLSHQ